MALNSEPKYPSRRMYVLKVRSDANPDALAGLIENLATGQQQEFASGNDLIESIARDIQATIDAASVKAKSKWCL